MFQARSTRLIEYMKLGNQATWFLKRGRTHILWNQTPKCHISENITHPLTKHEALSFMEDKLHIPNPEKLAKEDKHIFLNTLVEQMRYKIPYTTLREFTGTRNFKLLDVNELKNTVVVMKGGGCVAINSFIQAVLSHLNIKTSTIAGSVYRWRNHITDSHVALLVHDVTCSGSRHLVDVGSRYFLYPIDLGFTRLSPTYTFRNIPYKCFTASRGVIHLCTKVEEPTLSRRQSRLIYYEEDDCWEVLTIFRTKTLNNLSSFLKFYHDGVSDPYIRSLASELLVLVGYPNKLMVNITQHRCTTITEDGHKEVELITSKDHFIETIMKYFTQYTEEDIHNAAKYYFD